MRHLTLLAATAALALSAAPAYAQELLRNGGFEDEASGVPPGFVMWGPEQFKKPENFSRDTANPHSGAASLRIYHPANTRGYLLSSPFDNAIKPKPGMTYTFSFWARSDKPGKTPKVSVGAMRAIAPLTEGPSLGGGQIEVGTDWKQFTYTFVEGVDFAAEVAPYVGICIFASTTQEEERTLWIDDISVTERPNATAAAKAGSALPVVTEPFKDGDVVVCAGDSITHNGKYHRYLALFYSTRYPDRKVTIWNAGISGNVTQDMLDRFESDIAWRKPTVVTLMFGMNDVNGPAYGKTPKLDDLKPAIGKVLQSYQGNMEKIVGLVKGANARVILFDPSPYDQTSEAGGPPATGKNDALRELSANLKDYAKREKLPLVDDYSLLDGITLANQAVSKGFSFSPDRVHPNEAGHLAIAYAFLKSQGVSPCVSKVAIDAKTKKTSAENASVDNLTMKGKTLSFDCLEKALPYPIEWKAALGAKFVPFNEELNQELLTVTGLDAGSYTLSIDGAQIGSFDAKELAAGVNLATMTNTPQYKQALAVMALNDKRGDKELGLRSVVFLESDMRKSKVDPANPEAAKKFLAGIWDWRKGIIPLYNETKPKVEETVAEVRSLIDEMHSAAKPAKHSYTLAPASSK